MEEVEQSQEGEAGTSKQASTKKPSTSFAPEDVVIIDDDQQSGVSGSGQGQQVITREVIGNNIDCYIDETIHSLSIPTLGAESRTRQVHRWIWGAEVSRSEPG